MSTTRDYLEFLNQKIDIAPVNSEEEYQAAGLVEGLMQSHGLETRLQDFEASASGRLPYRICGMVLFVGVLFAGILGTALSVAGILLVIVSAVLLGLCYLGMADPLAGLGPKVHSQNVIGVHRGTGPAVVKGERPIVIVAHYDTPRESLLYDTRFEPFQARLRKLTPQLVCVAALLGLFQGLGFLGAGVRHFLWVIAIVAALPLLLEGIAAVQQRFAPCTEGSNDNKSGVAAMLGVMSMVHPGDDDATGFDKYRVERDREAAEKKAAAEAEAAAAADASEPEEGEMAAAEPAADAAEPEGTDTVLTLVPDESEAVEPTEDVTAEDAPAAEAAPIAAEPVVAPAPTPVERERVEVERVEGVRHGKETLEGLGILPDTCEIVYVEPARQVVRYTELPEPAYPDEEEGYDTWTPEPYAEEAEGAGSAVAEVASRIGRGAADLFRRAKDSISAKVKESRKRKAEEASAPGDTPAEPSGDAPEAVAAMPFAEEYDDEFASQPTNVAEPIADKLPVIDEDSTIPMERQGALVDGQAIDTEFAASKDASGLEVLATDETVITATGGDVKPNPTAPEDPDWGKSSFRPEMSSVARRAVLFDLPDPSESDEIDPLDDRLGDTAHTVRSSEVAAADLAARRRAERASLPDPLTDDTAPSAPAAVPDEAAGVPEPMPLETIHAEDVAPQQRKGFFRRDRKGDRKGGWKGGWKGGATQRADLRIVDGDDVRVQEDLRESVLGMGDDELVAHDIWFVALGGSYADHAGMKAFLDENRRNIRGCFLINLSCVGAGALTMLTSEGLVGTRKTDRRLGRLVTKVADDLHIDLGRRPHDWESTDATPAMQQRVRSATICGLTPNDSFALSQVPGDEPDAVDPAQAAKVAELVAEIIRRS